MKIKTTEKLNNGMELSIIEVDNPIAVEHYRHRFQVVLIVDGKKLFPRNKNKFLEFEENDYIYNLKSDKTNENVRINQVLFYELLLCDKSLQDCAIEIASYISLEDNDLITLLKEDFLIKND
jgi:hypothetical protein